MHLCRAGLRQLDFAPRSAFGPDRGLAPFQMELCFYPRGTVKEALVAYLRSRTDISPDTLVDYRLREAWLLKVLGEDTAISAITIETLDHIARDRGPLKGGIKFVTIGKRFDYFISACAYAAARRIISKDDVPVAPQLPDDSSRGGHVLVLLEFQSMRVRLTDRFRRFADIGYWTGHHTLDIKSMRFEMLEPDYRWLDPDTGDELWRGRYLRRCHKNRHCQPAWFPMERELREVALEWQRTAPTRESLVVGPLWNLKKNFDRATDELGIPRVRANLGLRSSFATMLAARGYSLEYIRQAQGHEGAPQFDNAGTFQAALKPTMDTRHYLRLSTDLITRELRRRRKEE
jgi:hypothetical protein